LIANLWGLLKMLWHVLTHILLVCVISDFPSFINLIFEESYRLKVNLFAVELSSINFFEFIRTHDDLHQARKALILELSL